jgi:cyanophycinase
MLGITLSLVSLLATAGVVRSMQVGKNFSMVLVGGGLLDDNKEIWSTIIDLAGGKGAKFGVVNAASGDPCCDKDSAFFFYNAMLRAYGAGEVYFIPVTVDSKDKNSSPEVVEQIAELDGFFFGGGDQQRIIYSL